MLKRCRCLFLICVITSIIFSGGCSSNSDSTSQNQNTVKKRMLFYVGITMIRPVSVLVDQFLKLHPEENLEISLNQGGSQDLYDSLKQSQIGDLYLPGSISYRNKNIQDGLLKDVKFVGFNRAAIFVHKGNPKKIPANLDALSSTNFRVTLCNPESGSIGRETKNILTAHGSFEKAYKNAAFLMADSRTLNKAIREDNADVTINWRATAFWEDNRTYLDVINIDESFARKKILAFNLLSSSKHPELAKKFMEFAASEQGRKVFYDYGFLDDHDLEQYQDIVIK